MSESNDIQKDAAIPPELRERVPLMRPEWMRNYLGLVEHEAAPRWNTRCGDRLVAADLPAIDAFAKRLRAFHANDATPAPDSRATPPAALCDWLKNQARDCQIIRERLAEAAAGVRERSRRDFDLARDFALIRPTERADFARRLERVVPASADLERLVVNPTSGTTGQPIPAPNHPAAVGCYDPLLETALRLHGLDPDYARPDAVAAIQICAQERTISYATVHAALHGAGFAKINLAGHEWRRSRDARKFIAELRPYFLSGDPYSFAALLDRLEAWREAPQTPLFGPDANGYRPQALISTALQLSDGLRERLTTAFACPLIDLYSLNETGPIACSVPEYAAKAGRMRQLPPDIFIEALDPDTGASVPDGQPGEIAITGGRNPYLPLLRYRTGDVGRVFRMSDGRAELELLHAREMVRFRALDEAGSPVNPVDIARIVRGLPIVQFQFRQRADLSCLLTLQTAGTNPLKPGESLQLQRRLASLFARTEPDCVEIEYTDNWSDRRFSSRGPGDGGRKIAPFVREGATVDP